MRAAPASDRTTTAKDNSPPPEEDDPLDIGDQEEQKPAGPKDIGGIAGERLLSFIQRIERLREERAAINEDIKEIRKEAKGSGFDTKVVEHLIRIRAKNQDDVDEFDTITDIYKRAIGMLP